MASIDVEYTKGGEKRYVVHYRNPEGKSREKWEKRKVDAEKFARNIATDIDRGAYIDPRSGRISVATWLAEVESAKASRQEATVARDRSLIDTHILPAFGNRQLASVKPVEGRRWVSELSATGLAADTVRKCHRLLANAFEVAVGDGLLVRSPATGTSLPKPTRSEIRVIDLDQIAVLAAAIAPRYRALVLGAAFTGLRFGELAALRVGRLDMLRRNLRVEEAVNEVEGRLVFGAPKTASSIRNVSMPKALVDELALHMSEFPPSDDGLVFTAPSGGPLRRNNFRRRVWLPAVEESVGPPLRFHDLRHSHAAVLIATGQHPKLIQTRLGHSSIRTTLDIYGHLFDGIDRAAADAIDEALTA